MSPTPPTLVRYAPLRGRTIIIESRGARQGTSRSTTTPSRWPTSIRRGDLARRVYCVEDERDAPGASRIIVFEHNPINRVFC